jgi:hypothetical protein
MKTCANCGIQNPDDAVSCQACSTTTFISSSPEAIGGHIISTTEQYFWQRMTFRQFAVVFVRMQAIWFLFNGIIYLTYLPTYFPSLQEIFSSTRIRPIMDTRAFMEVLRIAMHFAAAIVCIQFADRIVSWLVKDMVPNMLSKSSESTPPDAGSSTSPTEP